MKRNSSYNSNDLEIDTLAESIMI